VLAVAALACAGMQCASSFPVVHPATKPTREQRARAQAEEYFVRGLDYDHRGLPQMAARLYELAYGFDTSSDELRLLLAEKYIETGRFPQAQAVIARGQPVTELTEREKSLLATTYLKSGQFAKAAEVIEAMAFKSDEDLYSLAVIQETLNKTDLATESYLRFLRAKPEATRVAVKAAALMVRAGRYAQADSLLADLEQRAGITPDICQLRGAGALAHGDTAGALGWFARALQADSTFEEAMYASAQVHLARKDYPSAIAWYERLCRSQSWGDVYGRTLAMLYYYNEQYPEAARLLERLLETDLDDYELHFYLGIVAAARDSVDVARMELEKALALQSSFEDAWEQLCMISVRRREFDRALDDAGRFTRALENAPAAWRMLGYVRGARKEYGEAVKAFRRSLAIDSTVGQTWFELGSAFERQKQVDSAASAFRRALRIDPRDHVTANYLGYMWAELGVRLDSARALIRLALSREPDNGAYLDSYAWVFYQAGQYDSAYLYMTRAVAKIDNDPVVFVHLGDVQAQRGEYQAAAEAYEKALALKPDNADDVRSKLDAVRRRAPDAK